jgi:hypothetical protein
MTKRIRTTKRTTRRYGKHTNVKTRKRTIRSKTKKTRQRGGMFKAVVDSVLSRFQSSSSLVYAKIDFVEKLRPLLSQIHKNNYATKSAAVKNLMVENKDQINNVIWVTITGNKYTIHNPNDRVAGGTSMLLLQILLNVPEYKKDRSIYHVFLDNGGEIDKKTNPNGLSLGQQLPSDFDTRDERLKKKSKKSKKPQSSAPNTLKKKSSSAEKMSVIQEGVDDEGPIESVVEKPEQVEVEEDIVKSDLGLNLDDISLGVGVEPIAEERITSDVVTGPSYETTLTFWSSLFPGNELTELKSKFDSLIASDKELKYDELCRLCEIVRTIIPSFHVSFESVKNINGLTVFKQPKDIQNINIILCATMLLLGVIAKKLEKQDYTFMFKGGKGVQLAFAHTEKKSGKKFGEYESEDIDLIIIPNKQHVSYDVDKARDLALNISYLIRWFFDSNYKDNLDSQIMPTNPNVVKFAYQAFMRDDKTPLGNKLALMDIDFSKIPDENRPFYDGKIKMFHKKSDGSLSEDMLFYFQSLEQQINEKLYYYLLYTKYKKMLQNRPVIEITDEKYKKLTVKECNYYLTKFRKSLLALLRGSGEGYLSFFDNYKMDSRFSEVLVAEVQEELTK